MEEREFLLDQMPTATDFWKAKADKEMQKNSVCR